MLDARSVYLNDNWDVAQKAPAIGAKFGATQEFSNSCTRLAQPQGGLGKIDDFECVSMSSKMRTAFPKASERHQSCTLKSSEVKPFLAESLLSELQGTRF